MNDVFKNIEQYNPKQRKTLIILNDIIAGIHSNKKLNPIVTELFIRYRKLKHFSCFYYTILFCCAKNF